MRTDRLVISFWTGYDGAESVFAQRSSCISTVYKANVTRSISFELATFLHSLSPFWNIVFQRNVLFSRCHNFDDTALLSLHLR